MASSEILPLEGPIAALDLEWTAWEGSQERDWTGPGEAPEIVEIGAVRLEGDRLEESGAFRRLVRPRLNPQLSDYFVGLTGITQEMVDAEGVPFGQALTALVAFLAGAAPVRAVFSFGRDPWVLRRNCEIAGIPFPFPDTLFHNARPALAALAGRAEGTFSSSDLPALLGFAAPAEAHRALGDARCVAEGLRRLRRPWR